MVTAAKPLEQDWA